MCCVQFGRLFCFWKNVLKKHSELNQVVIIIGYYILHIDIKLTFWRSILYQFENSIGFFMYKYFFSQLWTHDLCCVQRTVGFFEESAFFIAPLFPLFPHIYSIVLATQIWANNWNSKNSLYNPLKSSFLSKSKDRKICQPRKGLLSRSYWKVSLKAWSRH